MRDAEQRQYVSVTDAQQWRERIRSRRAARSAADLALAGQQLADQLAAVPQVRAARCLTAYLSMPAEPPTTDLLARLHAANPDRLILVPRIAPHRQLEWVRWAPDAPTVSGPWGIVEPAGRAETLQGAELMIIPATAVDPSTGVRLGQGGGYYDRALAEVPRHDAGGPLRIAVVFDDEVVDGLPAQPWDQPVDVIVTPTATTPVTEPAVGRRSDGATD